MLFSRTEIASYIQHHFEPVWQNLRAAPIININFGDGVEVTRTLNGNIATSILNASGQVLDILPGIYSPEAYMNQLFQLRSLHSFWFNVSAPNGKEPWLTEYHQRQAATIKQTAKADEIIPFPDMSKIRVEKPVKDILVNFDQKDNKEAAKYARLRSAQKLAEPATLMEDQQLWKNLAEDTKLNETSRRLAIHEMLAKAGEVTPDKIIRKVYKEVLHTDLDDPYLGLSKTLFSTYPFSKEDQR